jgi:capsular polysaccharide biosynthesis protein
MFDLKNMNNSLLEMFMKNIKTLIIVGVSAAILSVVFSSPTFIDPKFQSQAVVYPSNLGEYSEESPIEQMMQWFQSRTVKENVIKELGLAEHYDIDTKTDSLGHYWLLLEYDENVSINETKYESAEITVKDVEPEMAYKMVNKIIENVNKVIRAEHKKRAVEDLVTIEKQFNRVKIELDSVSNELRKIRKDFSIINYGAQSVEVMKGYLKTVEGSTKSNINTAEVLRLKENLENKGGDFIVLDQRVYQLLDSYKTWEKEYNNALKIVNREMTYTNMVTPPFISYKKVYPVRWLIVAISTFSAVFFAFVFLLFSQKVKK